MQSYIVEDKQLCEEINNLSRVLNALEGELEQLKQGHSIVE
jgi:hypothetical protein